VHSAVDQPPHLLLNDVVFVVVVVLVASLVQAPEVLPAARRVLSQRLVAALFGRVVVLRGAAARLLSEAVELRAGSRAAPRPAHHRRAVCAAALHAREAPVSRALAADDSRCASVES